MTRRILGRFQRAQKGPSTPYIRALVEIPSLSKKAPVSFLVDTGAFATTLHPADAVTLGITEPDCSEEDVEELTGVGGATKYKKAMAKLGFSVGKSTFNWAACILIGPWKKKEFGQAKEKGVPSLLGRDFLENGQLVVDYVNDRVSVELHPEGSLLKKRQEVMSQDLIRLKAAPRQGPARIRRSRRP